MQSGDAARGRAQAGVRWDPSKFPKSGRDDSDWLWSNPAALLVIALLILVGGTWIAAITAPIAVELRNGTHATAAAHDRGTREDPKWWVTFEVADRTETHRLLPENVNQRGLHDGDRIKIVYNPANPSHVAQESDTGVRSLILSSATLLVGVILLATSGVVWFRRRHAVQQRSTATSALTDDRHRLPGTD
ncbi:DUF3592 domain-containing protein [Streptomyces sp. NPDC026673]|uniref:DUF3592 domain-containing protein n=1 Tax=Streptomyces sp. NPDC026673 TaxID=3155724 RepID=UPI0033F9C6A5